ncbi:Wzz/FepE/Etk N-terminal domain-containing protein [Legionella hackeliae]|uniref:Polysaccharide chain length determinant N-terminal domain-containing protein n=1 Tax=Legionella hackeliae TaxID=449 RepID=A0A0A8URT6_LEGHA|nr:Wzz/FepE/Etk N-terminal domain-containing protein [Legionella hackeliae]KTD08788.1 Chain length determinant protein [Legionella hackeliae]CEK10216.1 protein of unknown function [Legionella hackeliae]STX46945.1 Polysaccharide antigen chain regulator [Legionella hackeliae]
MEGKQNTIMNEIDIVDLCLTIWLRKWFILFVTLVCVGVGTLYVALKKPVYEAKGYISAPTAGNIAALNYGRSEIGEMASRIKPFNVADVYGLFTDSLLSESTKRKFFNSIYFPTVAKNNQKVVKDSVYNGFSRIFTVKQVPDSNPAKYIVTAKGKNPEQIVKWIKDYIGLANQRALLNLSLILKNENKTMAQDFEKKIEMKREGAKQQRYDRLAQLEEALKIAKAVDIDKQSILSLNGTIADASIFNEPSMLYLRGSKELEVEIKNLQERKSDDPFIDGLRDLQLQYDYYSTNNVNLKDVALFQLDGSIRLPDLPISPKKDLILLLSTLLGLMLAIGWIVLENFRRQFMERK